MQLQLKNIRAYGKWCYGCEKHGKDIMLAFMYEGDKGNNGAFVHDLFLTQEMAEHLVEELADAVEGNKNVDYRRKRRIINHDQPNPRRPTSLRSASKCSV